MSKSKKMFGFEPACALKLVSLLLYCFSKKEETTTTDNHYRNRQQNHSRTYSAGGNY